MGQFETSAVIYGVQDVNGKSTGSTEVVTLPNGFVIFDVQIVLTNASGIVLAPSISIGTNSSSFNNIVAISTLTPLSIANDAFTLSAFNPGIHLNEDDVVYVKVTTAAIATIYEFDVVLIGYPL